MMPSKPKRSSSRCESSRFCRRPQPDGVDRAFEHRPQPIRADRLFQEIESALLHRLDGLRYGRVARDHDHLALGQQLARAGQNLHAVDLVHDQIGDDHVVRVLLDAFPTFRSGGGDIANVADPFQNFRHGVRVRTIVVDDQSANRLGTRNFRLFRVCFYHGIDDTKPGPERLGPAPLGE